MLEQFSHVLPIDEDIGDHAIVHVSAARDKLNRSSAQQIPQPLCRRPSIRLAQFRCIDAAKPDPFRSDPDRVAVDDGDLVRADES